MGYEPSHTTMVGIISHYEASLSVGRRRVELGILAEHLLASLLMTIYVLPDLRSAVDEVVWSDTDDLPILIVKRFDPYMLLASYFIYYLRHMRDGCELWSRVRAQRMEKQNVNSVTNVVKKKLLPYLVFSWCSLSYIHTVERM